METAIYTKLAGNKVRCNICSHRCLLSDSSRGLCGVRQNIDGKLVSLVYGKLITTSIDPIEKKPMFHIAPGSMSYSIATAGCNFSCRFCQNSGIAQMPADRDGLIVGEATTPQEVIDDALRSGCKTIAFTYNEPAVFFEFARDTSILAHKNNIKTVFVSNGYMTEEAVKMISPCLDAANIDLKSFSDEFYKTYCGARLEPVKNTLIKMRDAGIFLEITTLLIPGLNDNPAEIEQLAAFIVNEIGAETPWHISRFHPAYRLNHIPPTPIATLLNARKTGLAQGLKYVYTGNVPGEGFENTYCHHCSNLLIERLGYSILKNKLEGGCCPGCGSKMHGVDL